MRPIFLFLCTLLFAAAQALSAESGFERGARVFVIRPTAIESGPQVVDMLRIGDEVTIERDEGELLWVRAARNGKAGSVHSSVIRRYGEAYRLLEDQVWDWPAGVFVFNLCGDRQSSPLVGDDEERHLIATERFIYNTQKEPKDAHGTLKGTQADRLALALLKGWSAPSKKNALDYFARLGIESSAEMFYERAKFQRGFKVLADYDKALRLDPNHIDARFERGKYFTDLAASNLNWKNGNEAELWNQAISDFDAVLERDRNHGGALFHRGLAKLHRAPRPDDSTQGQNLISSYQNASRDELQASLSDLDMVMQLDPHFESGSFQRDCVLRALNMTALAVSTTSAPAE